MESTILNDNWLFSNARAHCAECVRDIFLDERGEVRISQPSMKKMPNLLWNSTKSEIVIANQISEKIP